MPQLSAPFGTVLLRGTSDMGSSSSPSSSNSMKVFLTCTETLPTLLKRLTSSPELPQCTRPPTDSPKVGPPPSSSLLMSEPAPSRFRRESQPSAPLGAVLLRETSDIGSSSSSSSSNSMKVFLTCTETLPTPLKRSRSPSELPHRSRSPAASYPVGAAPPSPSLLASAPSSLVPRRSRLSSPCGTVLLRGHRESEMGSSSSSMNVFLTCTEWPPPLPKQSRRTSEPPHAGSSAVGARPSSSLLAMVLASLSPRRWSQATVPVGTVLLRGHRESDMGSSSSPSSRSSMNVFLTCTG
mmetsp:Transcript_26764/g.71231  ORF Transcript_26764/g.71231 Transcript_26764/m.71231 type:complete len:295 (+) Transcript_26764:1250-2134(+)